MYPVEGGLALAERAASEHVRVTHGGAFAALAALGHAAAGLSEIQATVLSKRHEGLGDRDIAVALGGKSESTVRNHRHHLRRKAAEARIFLALTMLAETEAPMAAKDKLVEYPASLPTKDDRAVITEAEAAAVEARCLAKFGPHGLRIVLWPKKQKDKLVVLRKLAELFEPGRRYSEPEVNAILMPVFGDHVSIRRYLVEYRFLDREDGGGAYWRTTG